MEMLPYSKIPPSPNRYTAGNIISKMLDGLGYRYYWATEGITNEDLNYSTADGARTTLDLLKHLCDLTSGILKVITDQPIIPPYNFDSLSFDQLRETTLKNLENSSSLFKTKSDTELENVKLVLISNGSSSESPLWNVLVGPITDTGYHIGQIVVNRRAAGNPINPNVNPFLGYTKEE